jgi:hypothetical protein
LGVCETSPQDEAVEDDAGAFGVFETSPHVEAVEDDAGAFGVCETSPHVEAVEDVVAAFGVCETSPQVEADGEAACAEVVVVDCSGTSPHPCDEAGAESAAPLKASTTNGE